MPEPIKLVFSCAKILFLVSLHFLIPTHFLNLNFYVRSLYGTAQFKLDYTRMRQLHDLTHY